MKRIIIILILGLGLMEAFGWWIYKRSKNEPISSKETEQSIEQSSFSNKQDAEEKDKPNTAADIEKGSRVEDVNLSSGGFPPPSIETKNGITTRTIHMGVRQWAWDPGELKVNYGEKVILIMHNADVEHSISIPELNVKASIPEEGAIVKFDASKRGTFVFSCNIAGHAKMEGRIVVN